MKEISDIIKAYDAAEKAGLRSVLATVVKVEGSSYRRPGARMLITEDGMLTGAISGGCLEGDARRKALFALEQRRPRLVAYDSMEEDGELFGIQLGCNGIVHILFEPIVPECIYHPVNLLKRIIQKNECACLITFFQSTGKQMAHSGTVLLFQGASITGNTDIDEWAEPLLADVENVLRSQISQVKHCCFHGKPCEALIDYIPQPVSLVIAGAGNDAIPLARMAGELGWQVTVIDGRKTHVTQARFPSVQALYTVKAGESPPAARAYVLMSHNYPYDLALLRRIITTECSYIGILGPLKKRDRMIADMQSEWPMTHIQRQKIFGPAGLDIGAETAEEIALSIISEIKSVLARKNAISLREKSDSIHERISA